MMFNHAWLHFENDRLRLYFYFSSDAVSLSLKLSLKSSFLLTSCGLFAELNPLFIFQDEQIDFGKQKLSVGEIQQKVKEYNAQINNNLYMVAVSD